MPDVRDDYEMLRLSELEPADSRAGGAPEDVGGGMYEMRPVTPIYQEVDEVKAAIRAPMTPVYNVRGKETER